MNKKSIGILAYYWPPAGGSGVQRWLRFSNHLCDLGWDVHVFTFKNPKYPVLDNSTLEVINPLIKVSKISGFEFPSFFTKLSSEESVYYHTISNNYPSFGTTFSKYHHLSQGRYFYHMVRELFLFPDARKFLINPTYKFLKQYYKENNLNALITTGPPHSMHLAGVKLKQDIGVNWVADFRDPWSNFFQNKLLNQLESTMKKHVKAENEVLKNCDAAFTTSQSLRSKFLDKNSKISMFLFRFKLNLLALIFFVSYLSGLKSATAAAQTAISAGKAFLVSSNICKVVSTFITFTFSGFLKFVGPDISVVSTPNFDKELAIS